MTGYGRGEASRGGSKVSVELSSVNRKQGDIALSLPRELESFEPRIREAINRCVSRGRLNAKVTLSLGEGAWASRVRLNFPLARAYAQEFRRLAAELKLEGGVAVETILRAPGVMESGDAGGDVEVLWEPLEAAVGKALAALVRMREREGRLLAADLRARVASLEAAVARVAKLAPTVLERHRESLRARIREVGLEAPDPGDERLLKELVYFADRSDISEELTRMASHFVQFQDCLKSKDPVGRTLDFLAQEMNREVNTMGSKANDARISREVVHMKTELEKFREQVQNVE